MNAPQDRRSCAQSPANLSTADVYRMVQRIASNASPATPGSPDTSAPTRCDAPQCQRPRRWSASSETHRSWRATPASEPPSTHNLAGGNLNRHGVHFLTA